jgi:preprotein translocase subunit YajC
MNLGSLAQILPFVVLIVVFYFFLIRPENKKKKKLAQMRNELAVGDEITTIGGMVGKICSIKDDMITFETGEDKVRIQVVKWAISTTGHDMQQKS